MHVQPHGEGALFEGIGIPVFREGAVQHGCLLSGPGLDLQGQSHEALLFRGERMGSQKGRDRAAEPGGKSCIPAR